MERGQWEVRLEGAGEHHLRFELKVPVNVSLDQKHFTMAIPEAPSTFFRARHSSSGAGCRHCFGWVGGQDGDCWRQGNPPDCPSLAAIATGLELDRRGELRSTSTPAAAAQVEIAIDPDLEAVATRSTWVIRCVRGLARKLEIRLDEQDVVQALKLDDQYLVAAIERNMLTIPLGEGMRPGETHRLLLETRRIFRPDASRTYAFLGFPLANAAEQSGAIGITQTANSWVNVTTAEGLHRIDPRSCRPSSARVRVQARLTSFSISPTGSALNVETSKPLYRSEASSRVVLDARMAQVETTLQIQRVRGRLFDLEIAVPTDLQLTSVGPSEVVESAIPIPARGLTTKGEEPRPAAQVLKVHLTPSGRDLRSFSLRLRGQQRTVPEGAVKLGLFATRDGVCTVSTVSLFADRELGFEPDTETTLQDDTEGAAFRLQPRGELPTGGPTTPPAGERSLIAVFKSNQNPSWLRGRLTRHPMSITHDTRITAHLARRSIDVRQDTELRVRHGSISSVTVRVPLPRSLVWQVQGKETIKREELDEKAGDSRRYRLVFNPPILESSVLSFRFQVPVDVAASDAEPGKATIPWIGVEEGTSTSTTVELTTTPGIKASAADAAWIGAALDDGEPGGGSHRQVYRSSKPVTEAVGFTLSARLMDQVALPPMVVPRVLLHTVLGIDNESKTHARYWIESHPATVSFSLPGQAQWIRARIDGRIADQVEHEPARGLYRLTLPPESQSKPVLVELEYELPAPSNGQVCCAPELPAEAVVLQTFWELQIPWNQAVIGVPAGWADENDWHWDFYVWKCRPWKPFSRLVGWVAGCRHRRPAWTRCSERNRTARIAIFSAVRASPSPSTSGWRTAPRSSPSARAACSCWASCSMFSRARFRVIWAVAAALCLVVSALVHPSVLLLVIQSALSGVVLTLLGLLIQGLVERAGSPPRPADCVASIQPRPHGRRKFADRAGRGGIR